MGLEFVANNRVIKENILAGIIHAVQDGLEAIDGLRHVKYTEIPVAGTIGADLHVAGTIDLLTLDIKQRRINIVDYKTT